MHSNAIAEESPTPRTHGALRVLRRIIQFPLTRIILAVLIIGAAVNVVRFGLNFFYDLFSLGEMRQESPAYAIAAVLAAHFAYLGYVRWIERRPADELSLRGSFTELGKGVLTGAGLFAATIGAIFVLGFYEVTAVNPLSAVIVPLSMAITAGYVEELLFRGILFRIIEESLGTWIALLISSAIFGLIHSGNPGATIFNTTATVLEAGVLLGSAYMLTRRLWLAIGLHFAWNFTQSGIFGVEVSGYRMGGLLESRLSGPALVSGGSFGAEASIFAVVFCLAVAGFFLYHAHRRGHVQRPFWRRKGTA